MNFIYRIHLLVLSGFCLIFLSSCGGKSSSPGSKQPMDSFSSVPSVIQDISSDYLNARQKALAELTLHSDQYVPVLKKLLTSNNYGIRAYAAWTLGKMGSVAKSAIPDLINILNDPDSDVRLFSIWALGKMGRDAKSAIPQFISFLKDVDDPGEFKNYSYEEDNDQDLLIRQNAALALSRMAQDSNSDEVINALIDVLYGDPNQHVRLNSAIALEEISKYSNDSIFQIYRQRKETSRRIALYARLCFRSEHSSVISRQQGAMFEDISHYSDELWNELEAIEIPPNQFKSDYLLNVARTRWSNTAILSCARKNFSYHSDFDQRWFHLFDQYGKATSSFSEGIDSLKEEMLNRPIIAVGNMHPLAQEQGDILFSLTHFFYENHHASTLLIEDSSNSKDYLESKFDEIRAHVRTLAPQDEIQYVDELNQFYKLAQDYKTDRDKWLHHSRSLLDYKYAIQYPTSRIIPVDLGENRQINVCGVDLPILQDLLNKKKSKESFLLFYGAAHTVRVGNINDAFEIEKSIQCSDQSKSQLVIEQSTDMNLLLNKDLDLGLPHHALEAVYLKFSFPIPEGRIASSSHDFLQYQDYLIEKYNAQRANSNLPMYVNFIQAQKDHALFFFNNGISPYDLLVIHPMNPISNSPFNIEKDPSYLFLKKYLEEYIQKLSWSY